MWKCKTQLYQRAGIATSAALPPALLEQLLTTTKDFEAYRTPWPRLAPTTVNGPRPASHVMVLLLRAQLVGEEEPTSGSSPGLSSSPAASLGVGGLTEAPVRTALPASQRRSRGACGFSPWNREQGCPLARVGEVPGSIRSRTMRLAGRRKQGAIPDSCLKNLCMLQPLQ